MHQFCTLVGYGADAICPYLAYEALFALHETGKLPASLSRDDIVQKYIKYVPLCVYMMGDARRVLGWRLAGQQQLQCLNISDANIALVSFDSYYQESVQW